MTKVIHQQFGKEMSNKVMLRQLAEDDELEAIVVLCRWKDKTISFGNNGLSSGEMALAALMLQEKAMDDSEI